MKQKQKQKQRQKQIQKQKQKQKQALAAPVLSEEDKQRERKDAFKRKAGRFLYLLAFLLMAVSAYIYLNTETIDTGYKGIPWYKQYTPDTLDLTLPQEESAPVVYETMQVAYGNSREFAGSGSIAAEDEKYFYIADPSKEGLIYSVSKADRSRTPVSVIPASELVLIKGRLYFINPTVYGEYKAGLYSCLTNGSSFEYHIEGSLNSMTADKGRLYYIRNNDERLYCYDPIADKEKCMCDDKCIDYAVSENALFYITDDEGRAAGADRVICRADADGETGFHLTEYGNYGAIGFIGDKLGYVIYDEGYGLIDPESDVTISLSMLNNKMVKMKGLYSLPVERDGSLWYIDRSRDRQLVCRDMQSRKEEEKDLYNVTSFYIMEDSMIISYIEGGVNRLICSRLIEGWEPAALFEGEL